jgi:hypothetical protein
VSLTENVHRIAIDAIDEVDTYAALIADGATHEKVAHRFGVTRRHVDQHLALSRLSPKITASCARMNSRQTFLRRARALVICRTFLVTPLATDQLEITPEGAAAMTQPVLAAE